MNLRHGSSFECAYIIGQACSTRKPARMLRSMSSNIKNLGKPATSRDYLWDSMVRNAWGPEFNAPDHGIYEFSNGRKWDSTDKGLTGLYGVVPTLPLEFETRYPDMDATLQTSDTADNLFTEDNLVYRYEVAEYTGAVVGKAIVGIAIVGTA